jgi:hypothetical protein
LERRFNLLKMDLKPLADDGEVGDVGSVDEGAVAVEFRVGAVASLETRAGAVGSSYKSMSVAVAVVGTVAAGVATTAVPSAGPPVGAAREASFDLRCSSFAKRSSSAFLVFSASFACFADAFSSAFLAFAARFSSSAYC